jgi:hypothetical protein
MAILEDGDRRPKLFFAHGGDHIGHGKADPVIIPKESGTTLSFFIDPQNVARAGSQVMRSDGTCIAAALDFWFTDSSKNTHYMVHAEFDSEDVPDERFVTQLRLSNIEFGDPTVFGLASVEVESLRIEPTGNRE